MAVPYQVSECDRRLVAMAEPPIGGLFKWLFAGLVIVATFALFAWSIINGDRDQAERNRKPVATDPKTAVLRPGEKEYPSPADSTR
jgi:hypothetical protein